MSKKTTTSALSDFVEQSAARLYRFCQLMGVSETLIDEVVEDSLRSFSRQAGKKGRAQTLDYYQVELFRCALNLLFKFERSRPRASSAGRDMRGVRALETDLLAWWRLKAHDNAELNGHFGLIAERLSLLDFDLRAPVVLHDHLALNVESIQRILELRFAVFRHRLHRGRMDLQRILQGVYFQTGTKSGKSATW